MSDSTTAKGNILEDHVAKLLDAVMKYDERFKRSDFIIKLKHTIRANNVPYEIDVWVETDPKSPHKGTFVYECKNWKEPVGKAEVAALASTVEAVGATRGFLVAREFTEHAATLAASAKRVELLRFAEEFSDLNIQSNHIIQEPLKLLFTTHTYSGELPTDGEKVRSKSCSFRGEKMSFFDFEQRLMRTFFGQLRTDNPRMYDIVANQFCQFTVLYTFPQGELFIDGSPVSDITVHCKFFLYIYPFEFVSKFEIRGFGRTCKLVSSQHLLPEDACEIELLLKG